jgi:hypothetical protein
MRWIKPVLCELVGLFVGDARFALTILLWLIAVALLMPQVPVPLFWRGILLFLGLAASLVGFCLRHVVRCERRTP